MGYTEKDIERYESNILKPSDTFTFECKMCGSCCRKRSEPIILTGLDIFRVAQALDKPIGEVLEKHTEFVLGRDSHLPIFVLKERLDGSCSLLRKGKCMVQHKKPVVCALFPLGRMYDARNQQIQYFLQPNACGVGNANGRVWTLQEWLEEFDIANIEEDSMAWNKFATGVSMVTCKIPENKISNEMINAMISFMYHYFDIHKPYAPQAERNMVMLQKVFKEKFKLRVKYDL